MVERLASALGIIVFIFLAWTLSLNRKAFPWRCVLWGLGLQLAVGLLILKTPFGYALFDWAQRAVEQLNRCAIDGAQMVFGPLADREFLAERWGPSNAVIFAVPIVAIIILVSALSSLLYHWGVLQRVVRAMALVMQRTMRTSGSESLAAAANIFAGQTEAPLLIKPYLLKMTQSELLTLMTGGMATIAGSVLAVYVSLGASTGHLLTASVMSAPAAILVAKILLPEREESETGSSAPLRVERTARNSLDALVRGASDGLSLALNVLAMLIAFVALVALANLILGWATRPFGLELTLQMVFGWANAPFAWLMGVPSEDCLIVGDLLGQRIVLNEFVGYMSLAGHKEALTERSFTIATYALCGFANFGSIGIQIGGIAALVPERRSDLARLGARAMLGGLLACYLTASLIGVLA